VSLILGYLATGCNPEQIIAEFPDLHHEQIAACLDYVRELADFGEEIMKKKFIVDQAVVNSIGGAFQHAGVYVKELKDADKQKNCLRETLAECLRNFGLTYAQSVTDEVHYRNIVNLANTMTEKFRDTGILRCRRFRIGIAQKALNLYLKYLWCLGDIPTPPHCPLDRRIIDMLDLKGKDRKDYDWTKLDDIKKYKELIEKCRNVAGDISLAEWELKEWTS
jgi:hypothetical protein